MSSFLAVRSVARRIIHGCTVCFKYKPVASEALMANLPKNRVIISRPFNHTGVNYAGPILLKEGRRRNAKMNSLHLYLCFTTKAVHMEIVSTSEALLGVFKRFISHRGRPVCMYSDNDTFVGAQRQHSASARAMITWNHIHSPFSVYDFNLRTYRKGIA